MAGKGIASSNACLHQVRRILLCYIGASLCTCRVWRWWRNSAYRSVDGGCERTNRVRA